MGTQMRVAVFVLLASLCPHPFPALSEQACDPQLKVHPYDPLGYRLRGDRCEGVFVEKVSSSIQIASLHVLPRDFQPRTGTSIRLSWSLPPATQVYIQAVSLRPNLFFRMDAVRPGNSTSYSWPMDFVEAVGLKSTEIGILSWATAQIGRQTRQLYSPVSVEGRSGDIEIVLVPEVHVEELYTSLVSLDGQGRAEAYTFTDRALKLGYYPAGQPVKIPLPTLKGKGIYRLEISGLVKGGGSITRDMYFVNRQN